MARIIKLKESDITNIVKRILREEKEGKAKKATSKKNLKKPSKKQMAEIKRKYFSGSVEESLKNYRMMYDKCPGWCKKGCMTPDELAKKVREEGDDHDDGPVGLIWVIVHIMCWAIVAWWYFDPNFPSDLRLKENIKRTGVSNSGIPVYNFNYKNSNHVWSGTMAQDLLEMGMGHAVNTMDNGYYSVNYDMIDVDMISKN